MTVSKAVRNLGIMQDLLGRNKDAWKDERERRWRGRISLFKSITIYPSSRSKHTDNFVHDETSLIQAHDLL